MPKTGVVPAAREAASRLAREMGYEFIDAELSREHGSVFLRIFIEHEKGLDLTLCEAFHRRLNSLVEHLSYDYLEVSSPGIDRPMKTERDFARGIGKRVIVKLYQAADGAKEYTGVLRGFADGEIVLSTPGGERRFLRKDCAQVKPLLAGDETLEEEQP